MCAQNLKFIALPVPEIMGVLKKIWVVPGYARAPFSPKIFMGICPDGPCERSFGWGCEPQSWEEEAVGRRSWHRSKER